MKRYQDPSTNSSGLLLAVGLFVVLLFFIGSTVMSYSNVQRLREESTWVAHTNEVMSVLDNVLLLITEAETGGRGYLLTGDEKYLIPYDAANVTIGQRIDAAERLTHDNAKQQERITQVKAQTFLKQQILAETIAARRKGGLEAAQQIMLNDRGRIIMDKIREIIGLMQAEERNLLRERSAETEKAFYNAVQSGVGSGLLGIFMSILVAWLLRRAEISRHKQKWLQTGQAQLSEKLLGEQNLELLAEKSLTFLCEYMNAHAGVIFLGYGGNFKRHASYAVPSVVKLPEVIRSGDGLLGQAIKDRRPFLIHDVPKNYLAIGSGLGSDQPSHLVIAPAKMDNEVLAVMELGFFQQVPQAYLELLERVAESIGSAVNAAQSRARIEELLEETQRQSEEVQAQSEELRVSNEELAEQSAALEAQQSRLEQQQAELEQTNAQLEEQTQVLEHQRDELHRAKVSLENQARIVEQASQYKSNFLANMSHELRTPLNSSLILAQLLAENRSGNLTEEQIKYARTIQSSGNDLLALINDVLDLSKIEAGRMDVKPQRVVVASLLDHLRATMEPLARQKGLSLNLYRASGAPEHLETDLQRVEQVLKNLLSNAVKFTEQGSVELEVTAKSGGRVAFVVKDTGIGISPEQQRIVFEPFRQADAASTRKYGGTGLGLSISRELARLLGGDIHLVSEQGRGSTFTLVIPGVYEPGIKQDNSHKPVEPSALPSSTSLPVPHTSPARPPAKSVRYHVVPDDRQQLTSTGRVILIAEDDESFAQVLADLAHEQRFQVLVATSAEEALSLAQQHRPSAIVLDVGLPDNSGLFVLERLKHDSRTRHIPVHMISASDHTEKARLMGAVGYLLKPVLREQLVGAFHQLETRLTQKVRRILIVEDDEVQLDALSKLLGTRGVETIGVQSASECLELLKSSTYDCMVLDLSLPDASGFSLLEKLSGDDTYSFPPVIVYTGRELGDDEEQQLRRYSKSIIIKGAKSPERLLDEVTLFLHQVVSDLPPEQQQMLEQVRSRDAALEGRRILMAEDDVRNVFALTSLLEPLGVQLEIARNGREALEILDRAQTGQAPRIDLVLMDIMMPEMDGFTAMREIRSRAEWKSLPIIALTAKAMRSDHEKCLEAGASDYLSKPLDVDKLLSLIRVWMPR